MNTVCSILHSATASDIRAEPFPHLVIEDALPEDYYRALCATFPAESGIVENSDAPAQSNTLHVAPASSILSNGPPGFSTLWMDFAAYHCSPGFYREAARIWEGTVRRIYPDLELSRGKQIGDFTCGMRRPGREQNPANNTTDIVLDCQIAINTPSARESSVRGPHVDHPSKLYAANLYMRLPEDGSTGGDLELLRYRDPVLQSAREPVDPLFARRARCLLGNIDPSLVELACTIPYRPNTLVMWINSPHAVHRVSPRAVTRHYRRYVNVIAESFPCGFDGFFEPGDQTIENAAYGSAPGLRTKVRGLLQRLGISTKGSWFSK